MTDFEFIQLNPRSWINFLVVDVDHPEAEMAVWHASVPAPHWVIVNPANGHAQAGWMIQPVFTGEGAAPAPVRFAEAVQRSLCNATGGDPAFSRHLVRNPIAKHPAGEVRLSPRAHPYSLGELKEHMASWRDPFDPELEGVWNPRHTTADMRRHSTRDGETTMGRNCTIFYQLRSSLWREGSTDHERALQRAQQINQGFTRPLPASEVEGIARSAVRQVQAGKGRPRSSTAVCTVLQALGRRGGSSRSATKVSAARRSIAGATAARSARSAELAQRAAELRKAGTCIREIAVALERSERTIKSYLAAARGHGAVREATGIGVRPPFSAHPAAVALAVRVDRLLAVLALGSGSMNPLAAALLVSRNAVAVELEALSRCTSSPSPVVTGAESSHLQPPARYTLPRVGTSRGVLRSPAATE